MQPDDIIKKEQSINKRRLKKVKLKAPSIISKTEKYINKDVLRRTKVRELRRMGYTNPKEIMYILNKGVLDGEGSVIRFDCSMEQIQEDMDYLVQEDLSTDDSFLAKRTVYLDQLKDLYRRAHNEFRSSKGPMKNNFLNTTFSILKSIIEMEGVLGISTDTPTSEEESVDGAVKQLQNLSEYERKQILSVLKKISEEDKEQGPIEEADISG